MKIMRRKKILFSWGQAVYTNNTVQEVELDSGTILDKTTDILHEQKKFYEKFYSSKLLNTNIRTWTWKGLFSQSYDIPKLLDRDNNKLQQPITQKKCLQP